jgi:hypothetical protein
MRSGKLNPDLRKLSGHSLDDAERVINATVQHDHELELARVIFAKIF